MTTEPTRGERNNNPGNIDRNTIQWRGMAADQSGDPRFCVFRTPHFGIRAIAKVLLSYYRKHGLNTVRGLISRWAPGSENDTAAYVADVAERCGIRADFPIKPDMPVMLAKLVEAIIHHENGRCLYTRTAIANAADDALGIGQQNSNERGVA